jgi:hypothetical protein
MPRVFAAKMAALAISGIAFRHLPRTRGPRGSLAHRSSPRHDPVDRPGVADPDRRRAVHGDIRPTRSRTGGPGAQPVSGHRRVLHLVSDCGGRGHRARPVAGHVATREGHQ